MRDGDAAVVGNQVTGRTLAPLVAELRARGDATSVAAADAICEFVVRQEEDARWQVRAGQAHERAQRIGEVSDERLAVLRQVWEAWWDEEPRGNAKRKPRMTALPDSPWYRAIAAVGDAVEPGWRATQVYDAQHDETEGDAL